MEEIRNNKNVVFCRIRMMKKEASDLAGDECIRSKNGEAVFAEDGRKKVWKKHVEASINEENPWDGIVNVEAVESLMEPFVMNDVDKALGIMMNGKVSG